jgi:uncharacterized protein
MRNLSLSSSILLVLAAAPVFGTAALAAQPDPVVIRRGADEPATLTAVGTGIVSLKPDRATVTLGIDIQADKSEQAQSLANQALTRILAAIRGTGVQDLVIQTSTLSLQPVFSYDQGRTPGQNEPKLIGYRATSTVQVRSGDLAAVGRLIDAGVGAGANRVDGIFFDVKDDTKARADALAVATKHARAQADVMATALGLKLGRVVQAHTGVRDVPSPIARFGGMKAMADSAPTPVEPGEMTISAEATVTFEAAR